MDNDKKDHKQFIVNNGIVYNKRDMVTLLQDLGNVSYYELVDSKIVSQGKGYIMRLCCNSEEPTLFLQGRIYFLCVEIFLVLADESLSLICLKRTLEDGIHEFLFLSEESNVVS